MDKISIIIPNYNGERFLLECLNSIYKNIKNRNGIEIIIIDDCSTDNSIKIIKEFKQKMPLKLIELKENRGVSNARNIGIEHSLGEYIFFLDSDDYLLNDAIDIMMNYTEKNYDIVYFNFTNSKNEKTNRNHILKNNREYVIKNNYNYKLYQKFLKSYKLNHSWGQLIKRDMASKFKFDTSMIMAEDFKYNINLFFSCKKILINDEKIIFYRDNNYSITHTKDKLKVLKKAIDCVNCYSELYKYDKKNIYVRKINDRINQEFLNNLFIIFYEDENIYEDYCYCRRFFNKEIKLHNKKIYNSNCIIGKLKRKKKIHNIKIKLKRIQFK